MTSHQSAAAPKPQPYEAILVENGWKAMANWEPQREENGWRFVGTCPHCDHRMDKFFPDHVLAMGMLADVDSPGERVKESVVSCNCGKPHPGGGDSASGCGAYWGIEVKASAAPEEVREGP